MSWSVEVTGTKAAVRMAAEAQFDRQAAMYAGKSEEKDVLSAKDRALAAIDSLEMDAGANGVRVSCSGSNSVGWSANLRVEVSRVWLCLDVPAPAPATPAT